MIGWRWRLPAVTLALALGLLGWPVGEGATQSAAADRFAVDETADGTDARPGDGACATAARACTLRAAIMEANALGRPTTIVVPTGVYKLELEGAGEDGAATGDLDVAGAVKLLGAGPGRTFIQGAGLDRVFDVLPGARLELSGARIRRGTVWGEDGGGIRNRGALALHDAIVSSNKVFGGRGGGVFLDGGSTTSLTSTSIWHNKATHEGGAESGDGGGIFNLGVLQAVNATVGNNQADGGTGGGLLNRGQATISSGTFSANVASVRGGAVANLAGTVTVRSTILADSLGGGDCHGQIESRGYNLLEDPSGCALHGDLAGTILGDDPRYGELVENGPHAGSYVLRAGSPAIDAGPPDGCEPTDQRGTPRPQDGDGDGVAVCDIGAYEHIRAPLASSRAATQR